MFKIRKIRRARWVRDNSTSEVSEIYHRNGIWWFDHPLPPTWHKCRAATKGFIEYGYVERCACGATRRDAGSGTWFGRNETRRAAKVRERLARLAAENEQ